MLTAVGHDGHVYALEKTEQYNQIEATRAVSLMQSKINALFQKNIAESEILSGIEEQIRQCLGALVLYGGKFYE